MEPIVMNASTNAQPSAPPYPGSPGPPQFGPTVGHAPVAPTVVPIVIVGQQMGPKPLPTRCRSCNRQILTRVEAKPSTKTHLFCLLLLVLGCWPCACIPYCVDSCQDINHYCPKCNAYLGTHVN